MSSQNGRSILSRRPDLTMESDASLGEAVCEGVCTGGLWSPVERLSHIYCLELTAAMFAVRALSLSGQGQLPYPPEAGQSNSGVIHKWNSFPPAGCSTMGMVPGEGNNLVRRAPTRCEELRGRLRVQSSAEWQLRKDIFQCLMREAHQCDVDLFATCLNHQLPQYVSWRPDPFCPGDKPYADTWKGYAFPPFVLISKILRKVREEKTILLIAPVWESQVWYPTLLSMLVDYPILLPTHSDLLTDHFRPASPISDGRSTSVSRMDIIWRGYSPEGISGEAAELLLSGWSKGTNTAYQSTWKKWISWCMQRQVDPRLSILGLPSKPLHYRTLAVQVYKHHSICGVHDSRAY